MSSSGGRGKGRKKVAQKIELMGKGPFRKVLGTLTHTGLAVCSQGGTPNSLRLVISLPWQGNARGFGMIFEWDIYFLSVYIFDFDKSDLAAL